ncbi:MAG: L-threonylcarbamoyladenylate synthase [Bacteroidota bacterium]|nr:L-threonylcarbamoyladenylate synthase [Bacteroidota bacterium]
MNSQFELEIAKSIEILRKGGTLLYPTDTIWGIGCDATDAKAVEKIYRIKKRSESKSLIILLASLEEIQNYVETFPEIARDLMSNVDKPLTIIYPKARNLAPNVIAPDGSIAIRIVRDDFCKKLITILGKPIVSTSANISGEPAPLVFRCVSPEISQQVDYVVGLYHDILHEVKPSRIIKLNENGEFNVIRP